MWSCLCVRVQVYAYTGFVASSGWSLGTLPLRSEWCLAVAGKPPSAEPASRTPQGHPGGRAHANNAPYQLQHDPDIHIKANTHKTCKIIKDPAKCEIAPRWTHHGGDDHGPARPNLLSFLILLIVFLLQCIWLLLGLFLGLPLPPFLLICLILSLRVYDAKFEAHLASIP